MPAVERIELFAVDVPGTLAAAEAVTVHLHFGAFDRVRKACRDVMVIQIEHERKQQQKIKQKITNDKDTLFRAMMK